MNKFDPGKLDSINRYRDTIFGLESKTKHEILKKIGFFSKKIQETWPVTILGDPKLVGDTFAVLPKEYYEYYLYCLEEIISRIGVEGIIFLNKEFGIIRFDRYGVEKMVKQYKVWSEIFKNREIVSECSVAFTAHEDNNSAFIGRESYGNFEKLSAESKKEKSGVGVVYFEATRGVQMLKIFLNICKHIYKIKNIYLGFHGGSSLTLRRFPEFYAIHVTPSEKYNYVRKSQLSLVASPTIKNKFTSDSFLVVDSCHSANFNGLAKHLSFLFEIVCVGTEYLSVDFSYTGRKILIKYQHSVKEVPEVIFHNETGEVNAKYYYLGEPWEIIKSKL